MSDLLTNIQEHTKAAGGRVWDSEPFAVAMAEASRWATKRAQAVKFIGLAVVGCVGWLIAGPVLAGVAAIAWFVIGFRCTDAYYSGWLERTIRRLGEEAERGQRLASIRRRSVEAAELLIRARAECAHALRLEKDGQKQPAANVLAGSFRNAVTASYCLLQGGPPATVPITYAEEVEFKSKAGFGEEEEALMTRLSLLQLSKQEQAAQGIFSMLPFHVLTQDVEAVIAKIEQR